MIRSHDSAVQIFILLTCYSGVTCLIIMWYIIFRTTLFISQHLLSLLSSYRNTILNHPINCGVHNPEIDNCFADEIVNGVGKDNYKSNSDDNGMTTTKGM